ncbi:MAG: hypothetical protein ACLT8E_04830 [Akkermansia sp.]
MGVYGLMPDDDVHLNILRDPGHPQGSTFFNVSGMTLDQRILVEPPPWRSTWNAPSLPDCSSSIPWCSCRAAALSAYLKIAAQRAHGH